MCGVTVCVRVSCVAMMVECVGGDCTSVYVCACACVRVRVRVPLSISVYLYLSLSFSLSLGCAMLRVVNMCALRVRACVRACVRG